jgi:TetR/AcrR family transcriptional repressor of nem operon
MQPLADTQQRILDSAHELFYSRSYADVGVAAICEHAGVKKGSFYHYFPSKRELTLAVVDKYYADLKEHFIDKAFADDLPPLARLERLAEIAYQFQKQIMHDTGRVLGCPFGNLATELSTQDEIIRTKLQRVFAKLQTRIGFLISWSFFSTQKTNTTPKSYALYCPQSRRFVSINARNTPYALN